MRNKERAVVLMLIATSIVSMAAGYFIGYEQAAYRAVVKIQEEK